MSTQESFINGFIKQASNWGISPWELAKLAQDDSSWLGRYMEQKALREQAAGESPWASMGGAMATGYPAGLAGALAGGAMGGPVGAHLGNTLGSAAGCSVGASLASQGLDESKRHESLDAAEKQIEDHGYLSNMSHLAGKRAIPAAALFSLLGAGIGGVAGLRQHAGLAGAGLGALAGAGIGGITGAGVGGYSGLVNKYIHSHTSPATHHRAKDTLAKHPMTSLPFGDMVGAANG